MVACLTGGAKDTHALGVFPRQYIRADGARRRRAQPRDRDIIRKFTAGNLTDDNRLEFSLLSIVENDNGMVQPGIFLVIAQRFHPLTVRHQTGCRCTRHAPLMDAHPNPSGNVDTPPWGVDLRVLAPLPEAEFNRSEERRVGKECRSRWS